MPQTTPFTAAEITDIRRYCGFPAFAAFGYIFGASGMANLDLQIAGMTDTEQAVVRTKYLPVLAILEAAVTDAGANLDTDVAAVWTRNRSEVADRTALYNAKRRELCGFFGVKPGAALAGGNSVVRC
jgi:hypothetical protein